jgi:hypothetical protein
VLVYRNILETSCRSPHGKNENIPNKTDQNIFYPVRISFNSSYLLLFNLHLFTMSNWKNVNNW